MAIHFDSARGRWPHAIKAVALDMDGLMFDTEPLYYQVGMRLLERRGQVFNLATQQRMMGRPAPEAVQVLIDDFALADSPEDLMIESDDLFAEQLASGLTPMLGLFELLEFLDGRSIPYGVATSSRRRFADQMLGAFDLISRMRFVLTGEDVINGKPDPEMYVAAADRFGLEPIKLMVLEDSENGCRSAVDAGACTVAIPGEHNAGHCYEDVWLKAESLADIRIIELLE